MNLKKYIGHTQEEPNINRHFIDQKQFTEEEKADAETSEGPYIFKPEWRNPKPITYGKLSEEVAYEKGDNIEQWTVLFDDADSEERAIVKVRLSALNPEIIEFIVELSTIPTKDSQAKDVMVNWKMFNGFDAKKTFWSDSNGLEMQERNVR